MNEIVRINNVVNVVFFILVASFKVFCVLLLCAVGTAIAEEPAEEQPETRINKAMTGKEKPHRQQTVGILSLNSGFGTKIGKG